MAKISPTLNQWLIEMKFDHIDRKRVRFSDLDSISAEAWIRLAEWARYNSAEIWVAYHSDPALGLERVAALASIEGIRPVSPSIIANSSSVMAILNGPYPCSRDGIKRNR